MLHCGDYMRQVVNIIVLFCFCLNTIGPSAAYGQATSTKSPSAVVETPLEKWAFDADTGAKELFEKFQNFESTLEELKKTHPGQPKSAFPFDVFLLMEQSAHRREAAIKSKAFHMKRLRALLGLVEGYLNKIKEDKKVDLRVLSSENIEQLVLHHVRTGRAQDTPLFIWERKGDQAQLTLIREELLQLELKWAGFLESDFIDEKNVKNKKRKVNWWDLDLRVYQNDSLVTQRNFKEVIESFSGFGLNNIQCAKSCQFELWSKDEKLNSFYFNIQQATLVGSYLMLILEDSFDQQSGIQAVHFIDLAQFSHSLGEEELPVFRLPFHSNGPLSIVNSDDYFIYFSDGQKFSLENLGIASDIQDTGFQVLANTSDPSSWSQAVQLAGSLNDLTQSRVSEAKKKMLETSQEDLNQVMGIFDRIGEELNAASTKTMDAKQLQAKSTEVQRVFREEVLKSNALGKTMMDVSSSLKNSRRLGGKLNALSRLMVSPKPLAATKAKLAVTYVAKKMGLDRELVYKKGFRYWKWGASLLTAVAAGADVQMTLAMSEFAVSAAMAIANTAWFAIAGLGMSSIDGTGETLKAFYSPMASVWTELIANGRFSKMAVGVAVFTVTAMSCFFVPHILFNAHQARKDMKAARAKKASLSEDELLAQEAEDLANAKAEVEAEADAVDSSAINKLFFWYKKTDLYKKIAVKGKLLAKPFIDRQNNFRNNYLEQVSKAEMENRKVEGDISFTEHEWEEVQAFISERTRGYKKVEEETEESTAHGELKDFKTLSQALIHFVFSMPAFELNMQRWSKFWNQFVSWRYSAIGYSFVQVYGTKIPVMVMPKPKALAARIMYPEFFSTLVSRKAKKTTIPTEMNGGLRPRWTSAKRAWQKFQAFRGNLQVKNELEAVDRFQEQVVDIEEIVVETSFKESLMSLTKNLEKPEEIKKILTGKNVIKTLTQEETRDLSATSRFYLQAMFDQAYGRTMLNILKKILIDENGRDEIEISDETDLAEIKKLWTAKMAADPNLRLKITKEEIVNEVLVHARDPELQALVWKQAKLGYLSYKNLANDMKFSTMAYMDPAQNKSMERYAIVEDKLKSPMARGRVVRKEITKLLLTFPVDVALRLILLAGATNVMVKPVNDDFWSPTSIAYLSAFVFYGEMLSGFVGGIMADSWVKMQEDHQNDKAGNFGEIPQGEDAEKGFLRWYWKKFTSKANSYATIWKMNGLISFWNFPSVLIYIAIFDLIFKQRFDLSLLLGGYVVFALLPFDTIITRMNQAFESAVHYSARGVKNAKWFSVPKVTEIITRDSQKLSFKFNWVIDILTTFSNMTAFNIMTVASIYGPRTWMRSTMGGWLPEELIVNELTRPIGDFSSGAPFIGDALKAGTDGCEWALTNGNSDLTRIKPK